MISKSIICFSALTLLLFNGCNLSEKVKHGSPPEDRFGGGCNSITIGIFSLDKNPLKEFKLPDFCASPTSADLESMVSKVRNELLDDRAVRVKIQCEGHLGANQFILMDLNIVGYRKICDNLTGSICRHEYKVDDLWQKELDLFSQACANKMK